MAESSPTKPNISLLYVEDDLLSRDLIKRVISLKFPELELYLAENGKTGLEIFREQMPQIVMTDIKMPIMDGVTMVSEIKVLRPATIIIIVAANCDADYLLKDNEIDYCVTKPIDNNILFGIIEKCIADVNVPHDCI